MKSKKIKRETWRTTDAEERAKRQERAKVEPMKDWTVYRIHAAILLE